MYLEKRRVERLTGSSTPQTGEMLDQARPLWPYQRPSCERKRASCVEAFERAENCSLSEVVGEVDL